MARGSKASAESDSPSTGDKRKRGSEAEEHDEKSKEEGQEEQSSGAKEDAEEEEAGDGKPRTGFL